METAAKFFLIAFGFLIVGKSRAAASAVVCDVETRNGIKAFGTVDIDSDRATLIEDRGADLYYWITEASISPMAPAVQFDRKKECQFSSSGHVRSFQCGIDELKAEMHLEFAGTAGKFWGRIQNLPTDPFSLTFGNCK